MTDAKGWEMGLAKSFNVSPMPYNSIKYMLHLLFYLSFLMLSAHFHGDESKKVISLLPDQEESVKDAELFAQIPRTSPFSEEEYDTLVLKMYVSSDNVPSYWFEKGHWQVKDKNCQVYGDEDEVVSPYQLNVIKRVRYYRYKNVHPLDPEYYTHTLETGHFLKRFCFFKFTGKTLLPWLDVCLFALDMHTGLLFRYAIPSTFKHIFGKSIARDWVALERHPEVQKLFPHKQFYEFDPIGSIQADGKVLLYDWVIELNKQKRIGMNTFLPRLGNYAHEASKTCAGYSPYRKR